MQLISLARFGAWLWLLLMSLAPLPNAQSGSPPPPGFGNPECTFTTHTSVPGHTSSILAVARHSTSERKISFEYSFIEGTISLRKHEQFVVDYWPTGFAKGPDHSIYVVGKGFDSDHFVAEVWRYAAPKFVPGRVKPDGTIVPPSIKPGLRTSVARVHDESMTDGLPVWVIGSKDNPVETFLIFFSGSRRIWKLSASNGAKSLVASPSQDLGALHEPGLQSFDWRGVDVRQHVNDGNIYVLRCGGDVDDPTQDALLLMTDANRDGVLDDTQVVDTAGWQGLGYHKANVWVSD